jgi:hypothetical protein
MNERELPERRELEDRRKSTNDAILILVQQVHSDVKEFNERLASHMHDETLALAEAVAALMIKSFPEGDPDGHRKGHEAQMIAIEARAEFWKKMLFEVTKYGLLGVIGWLVVKVWIAFLAGPNK